MYRLRSLMIEPRRGRTSSTMYILISLIVSSILPAAYYCGNVCPSGNAQNDVIDAHGVAQEGIWHRLTCPEFRPNEELLGFVWYKGSNLDSAGYLIGYFEGRTTIMSSRYEFSTDNFNLVIKGVEATDEGSYLCSVIPSATIDREGKVELVVIGDFFPASSGDEQDTASLQRGRRNQLPCDCASHFPPAAISVVYWSTGEGVSTDTNIIGARFANGSVLQIQHGASYGIDSDFSLQMNSLGGVHDEQRFWCHVFKSDGTPSSCYTDVTISGDQPPDDELAASSSSFYVLNGKPAILPCMSWEPGDPACNVQWFKVDDSDRHLLTYDLSTGDLGIESGFDLADNFGLLVTMVNESSAGTYRCDIDRGRIVRETEVFVIGANFPLDGGDVTIGQKIKLKPNRRQMLRCPVKFSNTLVKKTTIFWSFGTLDEQKSTTVIGNLVLPEGIKTMSDLSGNRCYDISYTTGSLLMTNCSQDTDVRYWCHVFIEGGVLHRSYADVTVDVPTHPVPVTIVIIVIICIILLILVVVVVSVCVWRRHKTSRRNTNRDGTYESVEMEECRPAETLQRAADLCEKALKKVYKKTCGFIPLIPWVDDDKRHTEMYTNLVMETWEGYRYRSQTIKPGKLNSYEVVLELETEEGEAVKLTVFDGLPGRGKSTLFAKIAYDWATGSVAMQGYKLVVLLKMNALEQSSHLIDAMFDQLLGNNVRIKKGDLQSYMETNPEKVLILLDGFDELITTDFSESLFGSVLNILNQKEFRGCCTLVSTRPSHYDKLVSKQLIQDPFTHVKVLGFSDKEIREYVHRFYSEEHDQAEALLAKIQSTNIPPELRESPMLLLLMCLLWREDNLPDTMSRLYSQAVKYIFRRKGETSEANVDTCVQEIGKVGLKGLLSPEQMLSFKEKDFKRNAFRLAIQAGILTSEKVLKKLDTHNSVQFIHKTFEEYCSGKYLQHLQVVDTEEFHKILDQIMSQGPTQFGFLLRFCCGDSEACTRTILQLFQERFPLVLTNEGDVRDLALECYVEGQSEKVFDEVFVHLVIPTHLKLSKLSALTRFLKCVGDQTKRHGSDCFAKVTEMTIKGKSSQQQVFLPAAVHYMSEMTNLASLTFHDVNFGLEPTDMSTAESVCVPPLPGNMPRSGVQFSGKQVWSELLKKMKNLHRLELTECKLTVLYMKYIAEALCSLPSFVELFVYKVILNGSGASWSIFLKEWNSLQKLCLWSCSLTGQDMKRITESLVNLPDFVELNVYDNVLEGSLELWSENLKQLTNLEKLRLADCLLSKQDVIHCTEAFSGLPNLEELDLGGNSLHGSVALLSPRLQSLQQLQRVDLWQCSLTGEDVKHIAKAIRSLPNLKSLNLSRNDRLKSSAALRSAELGSLKQLQYLNLHHCGLTEPDVEHVAKSLGDLPKLSEVDLSYNVFLGGSSSSWSIHLKHVKYLHLINCFMEEANFETFAKTLSHLTMLVELNLSWNHKLGGSGEMWCEHFKHFKNLQKFDLSWCSLTGEDMKHIVQSLGSVPSLVELDLSANWLPGSGALWGKQLQLLKSLQKLKLSDCDLQGDDMNHILEPLSRLPHLAELDFSLNRSLGGSAALWSNHLQQFSELQKLNFDWCNLTWDDKKVIWDSLMIQQRKGLVVTCRR